MAPQNQREWTLMFYFASDNGLAPEVVSQLKAIKQAGFHDDANIIAQFDPNAANTDTHIFDVNRINKLKTREPKIGFVGHRPEDPYVVNLMIDKVWSTKGTEGKIRQEIIDNLPQRVKDSLTFDPPEPPPRPTLKPGIQGSDELDPGKSLAEFLTFCGTNYPARHYMLFIIGHGLVVGNDTFLLDENAPSHSLTLSALGEILNGFRELVEGQGAKFELISFHSCSLSSLEVAYELQYKADGKVEGTANYMLAAQGPSFVGSWPYRQILIKIFNYLEKRDFGEPQVKELFRDIFSYCLYNSYDYIVAGYNFDVCLCDLNKVSGTQVAVSSLSEQLIKGLTDPRITERLLLAHWDAQSFWSENYIDLHDFCLCIKQRFKSAAPGSLPEGIITDITEACDAVNDAFKQGNQHFDDLLVVRSRFAGTASQYSRGLSVFFPWSRPVKRGFWPEEYNTYRFFTAVAEAGGTPWSKFLAGYFDGTKRKARSVEDREIRDEEMRSAGTLGERSPAPVKPEPLGLQERLLEKFATRVFDRSGQLAKDSPRDSQGDSCDCPSLKNYPSFTREPDEAEGTGVDPHFLSDTTSFVQGSTKRTFVLDDLDEAL
jgi:hypothetical protein